jgi:hypothetical protein
MTKPKCYCTAPLLPDGTCRHKCDPALRRPSQRRLHSDAVVRQRARDADRCLGLSQELLAEKARRTCPTTAGSASTRRLHRRASGGRPAVANLFLESATHSFEEYAGMKAPELPANSLSALQVRHHRWETLNFGWQPSWTSSMGTPRPSQSFGTRLVT